MAATAPPITIAPIGRVANWGAGAIFVPIIPDSKTIIEVIA
jgi:hypothetical protein